MSKSNSIRVGKVTLYARGSVWYLRYFEHQQRHQVRAGPDKAAARRLAAEVNAQLETGALAASSFETITLEELRRRWLDFHEHIRRSSVATLSRYRTATEHLLVFARTVQPVKYVSGIRDSYAEAFAKYLRGVRVSPNGHKNAAKRTLHDKGIKYVLAVCRSLLQFALKRRHLPPYTENPFATLQIDLIPVEDAKPIVLLTTEQERAFFEACDPWQFPIFATLALTGLRPGELTHLLVENLDLQKGLLDIQNKPELGWQVKTRNERTLPLIPELTEMLRGVVANRTTGPVFLRRPFYAGNSPLLIDAPQAELATEAARRTATQEALLQRALTRAETSRVLKKLWVDMGAIREDRVRTQFVLLTCKIGLPTATAPKVFRHMFATLLQDANVDPLIRNQLMGHSPSRNGGSGELGMTAVYTHSRPETVRRQLTAALQTNAALAAVRIFLYRHTQQTAA